MSQHPGLNNLVVTGDVSVRALPHNYTFSGPYEMIMIMGATGAGKSSFIEALCGNPNLGLSKDQLEGFTQHVSAYELVNVKWKRHDAPHALETVYILDTPGFSDSQISEMEIVLMVNAWMKAHQIRRIEAVIYACRITDTRLPKTKRRTIDMLQSLAKVTENPNTTAVTIATTMWDQVWTDEMKERANEHLAQLRDEIWKELTARGGLVMKFENDQASALRIVDATLGNGSRYLALGGPVSLASERDYVPDLYQDLLDRIGNAKQVKDVLELDLAQPDTQANEELRALFEGRLREAEETLAKFQKQLADFGDPPLGFGYITLQLPSDKLSGLGRFRRGYHSAKNKGSKLLSLGRH